jgi:hypothetical protein
MHRTPVPIVLLLVLSFISTTHATDPRFCPTEGGESITPIVDAFYCQDPDPYHLISASSGFDSELADDIPAELAGQQIEQVTLYVSEWMAPWRDPLALVVNFYDSACPPGQIPVAHYEIPWSEVDTTLVLSSFPRIVYESVVTLPAPVTIQAPMSIGSYVVIDWGQVQPWCGLAMTPETVAGCGEAYWDFPGTAPRWTLLSVATGYDPRDLAYCLTGGTTAVSRTSPGVDNGATWGRIRRLYE